MLHDRIFLSLTSLPINFVQGTSLLCENFYYLKRLHLHASKIFIIQLIFYPHLVDNNCTAAATPANLQCYESSTDPNGYVFDCIDDCEAFGAHSCSQAGEVCASDFGTYPSKCEMSKYACEAYGKDNIDALTVTKNGKCDGT